MDRRREVVNELHKPARKNFIRRHVTVKGIDDLWQADLVEMIPYSAENKGYRYLLTVIDTFSKYAWGIAVKNKTGVEITKAFQSILKQNRIPKNLQTDDGKEFYNKDFKALKEKHKINHYSTYSTKKASIVERFNRTLKNIMWKEFSMTGKYRWINIINELIHQYNNTKHRTIKMMPADVNKSNEKQILSSAYNRIKLFKRGKYKVGDFVRISKYKHIFEKSYTPNWTTEIFVITKVQNTNPVTYILKDYEEKPIQGGFYEFELSKIKYPDLYLVEQIIKERGNKVYVKWLGFSQEHNSWINKNEVF